jgi:hypothetical protein
MERSLLCCLGALESIQCDGVYEAIKCIYEIAQRDQSSSRAVKLLAIDRMHAFDE